VYTNCFDFCLKSCYAEYTIQVHRRQVILKGFCPIDKKQAHKSVLLSSYPHAVYPLKGQVEHDKWIVSHEYIPEKRFDKLNFPLTNKFTVSGLMCHSNALNNLLKAGKVKFHSIL